MRNFADICLKTRFFQRDSGLRKTNPYTNIQKAVSHIKQNTGRIHMKTFSRILRETDYRLNKTFYLASQTAYIIGQLEEMSEEQVDGQRHRSI